MIENPVTVYRRNVREQANHRLTRDRQAELQRQAVERHERELAEREQYLDSLKMDEQPSSSPAFRGRIAKFIPKSKPKAASRVATIRARTKPATRENQND